MKKYIAIALTLFIVGGIVNDVSRYAKARYDAVNTLNSALEAVSSRPNAPRNENAMLAANHAAGQGATVYLYDQDTQRAYVWVEKPVYNTWLLGPFNAWATREPLSSPYKVRVEGSTAFR